MSIRLTWVINFKVQISNGLFNICYTFEESQPNELKSHARAEYKLCRSLIGPVVGWPPVGSFRKNQASKKQACSSCPNKSREEERDRERETQHTMDQQLFVKIYMEGFPIGRKVNLRAYDSYDKLSIAIDELFGSFVAGKFQA